MSNPYGYGFVNGQNYVYDSGTLSWVPQEPVTGGGGGGDASAANQVTGNASLSSIDGKLPVLVASRIPVTASSLELIPISGSVSASGNNTLITPASGNRIRLYYGAYNPSASVEVGFRFGAAGTLFLRNNIVTGGSIIAKDFGDLRYVQGAVNEALILNLSSAVSTIWNVFYLEV